MTTRPPFGVVTSPLPLSSCSVRLTCTVDMPVASELGLGDRQLVSLPIHQADGLEAHIDFAQDVRDPGVSIAPAGRRFPNLAPPKHRLRRQNPHDGNRAAE